MHQNPSSNQSPRQFLKFPKRLTKLTKSTGKTKLEENRSGNNLKSIGIQSKKNEYQHTESPQGRTTITKKRQGDANHRNNTDCHTYIDKKMKKYYRDHAVAKNSGKG